MQILEKVNKLLKSLVFCQLIIEVESSSKSLSRMFELKFLRRENS